MVASGRLAKMVISRKKPRMIKYSISLKLISVCDICQKRYSYNQFEKMRVEIDYGSQPIWQKRL
jgi:hypothetical protein